MSETPSREDVEAFIDSLENAALEPWQPVHWREIDDPDENSYRVLVGFQHDPEPHQERRFGADKHKPSVRAVVAGLEDETDDGAFREKVLKQLTDKGVPNARDKLEEAKRRGEVYEPRENRLRTV